jgi:hypothetical protein
MNTTVLFVYHTTDRTPWNRIVQVFGICSVIEQEPINQPTNHQQETRSHPSTIADEHRPLGLATQPFQHPQHSEQKNLEKASSKSFIIL